jgi:predicted Zn finger-like uncharacterized protein
MRIVCDSCGAVYKIADSKLVKEVNKATCKRCGHKIIIRKPRAAASVEGPSERTIISPGGPSAEQGKKKKDEKTVITTIPELEKYESAAMSAGAIGSLTSELRTISSPADIPSPPATESLGPGEQSFSGFDNQSQVAEPAPMPMPPEIPPPPTPPGADGPTQTGGAMAAPMAEPELPAPPPPAYPDPSPATDPYAAAPVPMPAGPAAQQMMAEPSADAAGISIAIPPEAGPLFNEANAPRDRLAADAPPTPAPIHDADLSSAINQAPPTPSEPAAMPAAGEVRTATREVEVAPYHPRGELVWILLFSLLAMAGIALATLATTIPVPYMGTVGFGLIWTAALSTFLTCILSGFGRRKGRAFVMAILGLLLGMGLAFGLTYAMSVVQTQFTTQLNQFVGTGGVTTGAGTTIPTTIDQTVGTGDATTTPADGTTDAAGGTGTVPTDGTAEDPTPAPTDVEEPTAAPDATADADPPAPEAPAIVFTSSPSRAEVYMDGRRMGRTPYRYEAGRASRSYTVTMKKDGYEDTTVAKDFPRDGVSYAKGTLKKEESVVAAAEDPTPEPEEELPEYTDVLAPSIIEAIVGSNAAVKRCFAEAKARDEVVSGKIWVKFTVAPSGEVAKAHIVNSDLSGTDLDSCVSAQINRLQFAAFRGSTSKVVKYPFVVK